MHDPIFIPLVLFVGVLIGYCLGLTIADVEHKEKSIDKPES